MKSNTMRAVLGIGVVVVAVVLLIVLKDDGGDEGSSDSTVATSKEDDHGAGRRPEAGEARRGRDPDDRGQGRPGRGRDRGAHLQVG